MSAALWFRLRHLATGWLDSQSTSRPICPLRLEVLEDRTLLSAKSPLTSLLLPEFALSKLDGGQPGALPGSGPVRPGVHNGQPPRPAPVLVPTAPDQPTLAFLPAQLNVADGLERTLTIQVRVNQPQAATHAIAFADSLPVQSVQLPLVAARQQVIQVARLTVAPPTVIDQGPVKHAPITQEFDELDLDEVFAVRPETPAQPQAPADKAPLPATTFVMALPSETDAAVPAVAEAAAQLAAATAEIKPETPEQTDGTWAVLGTEAPVAPVEMARSNPGGELLPILAAIFVTSAVWHLSGSNDRKTTEWPKPKPQ